MDRLDRASVKTISTAMAAALQAVAKQYGVSIDAAGARFSDAEGTFKFKVRPDAPGADVLTQEQRAYDLYAEMNNMPSRDTVVVAPDKSKLRLIGWSTRARKYPVVAVDLSNNSRYKLGVDYVAQCTVA